MTIYPVITELTDVGLPGKEKTWTDRVAECGCDWTHPDFTKERFSLTLPEGPCQLALAHFGRMVTIPYVEEWGANNGYELAVTDEGLAVGSHPEYKKLQLEFPIIIPGSTAIVDGDRRVPCLYRCGVQRDLNLSWYDHGLHGDCRFLVRKARPLAT